MRALLLLLLSPSPHDRLTVQETVRLWFQAVMPDLASAVFLYKLQHTLAQPSFHVYDHKVALIYHTLPLIAKRLFQHEEPPVICHSLPIAVQKIDLMKIFESSYESTSQSLRQSLDSLQSEDLLFEMKKHVSSCAYKYHNGGDLEMQEVQQQIKEYKVRGKNSEDPLERPCNTPLFLENLARPVSELPQ